MSPVFVTSGGARFHADRECSALATGRGTAAYRAGETYLPGAGGLDGLYPVAAVPVEALAHSRYTACRVCVPPALALPATGQTYGHEPVTEVDLWGTPRLVCARCTEGSARWGWDDRLIRTFWPCTSAAVLGLVVIDADRWNARYPIGTPVTAYPDLRPGHPAYNPTTSLHTVTRTPAWRLGHGDSVVSVNGHAGGIALTHVDPL